MIDLPCSAAWKMPSGVSTPWLMALLRKNTLAGSMRMLTSGRKPVAMSQFTAAPARSMIALTRRAMTKKPKMPMKKAVMPAENMLTSISKPARILPSHDWSSFFMTQADSGPRIIAPMNMCTWPRGAVPSGSVALKFSMSRSEPAIAPIVANAATTPPRSPCTMRPPVAAISRGNR